MTNLHPAVQAYRDWLYRIAITEWGCTKAQARRIAYERDA